MADCGLFRNCGVADSSVRTSRFTAFQQAIQNPKSPIRNSSGVWCNASIRVLGTRGDSSILSSPTKLRISDFELRTADLSEVLSSATSGGKSPKSEIRNPKSFYAPVAQLEECDASNVEVAGSSPARSSKHFRLPIADCRLVPGCGCSFSCPAQTLLRQNRANRKSAIGTRQSPQRK
jgi:hypothetical protein